MRKLITVAIIMTAVTPIKLCAQGEEAQQLLLNVQKLAQLKQILTDLKKAYTILYTGYNSIKNISEGNFNLHKSFLDGLLAVSPTVRKYRKVADIISHQKLITREYKDAFNRFKADKNFTSKEIDYLANVYLTLFNESVKNLDALFTIITANTLRMSDDERIKAIDEIFSSMQDKLIFLRQFNNNATVLSIQRAREKKDITTVQKIYGLNN